MNNQDISTLLHLTKTFVGNVGGNDFQKMVAAMRVIEAEAIARGLCRICGEDRTNSRYIGGQSQLCDNCFDAQD